MKGSSHTVVAAAAWAWAAPPLLDGTALELTPFTWAVTTTLAGGAGLLPDCDHHAGTIAHSLGPPTKYATRAMSKIFGGHRGGTHSLVFAAGSGALSGAAYARWPLWTLVVVLPVMAAWFARTQASRSRRATYQGAALALGAVSAFLAGDLGLLVGLSIAAGTFMHLVGDLVMRDDGVPLLWPAVRRKFSLRLLAPERRVTVPGAPTRKEGGQGERAVAWISRASIPVALAWVLFR